MINNKIATEIRDAVLGILKREEASAEVQVKYNGGSTTAWTKNENPVDTIVVVSVDPAPETKPAATIPHATAFANVEWFKRALADKKRLDEYYGKCEMWGVPRDRSDAILEEVRKTSLESLYLMDVVKEATTLALRWAIDNPGKRL